MTILIVGRTGSGKDYLANQLCNTFNLVQLKSFTTRPKRTDDEDTHIFITESESKNYEDRVAETVINGYEYFATRHQVYTSDIYLIDPNGIKTLLQNMPDSEFVIIYASALDSMRLDKAVNRVSTDNVCEIVDVVNKRNLSENAQFALFEQTVLNNLKMDISTKLLYTDTLPENYSNVKRVYLYPNSYNEDYCNQWIDLFYDTEGDNNAML